MQREQTCGSQSGGLIYYAWVERPKGYVGRVHSGIGVRGPAYNPQTGEVYRLDRDRESRVRRAIEQAVAKECSVRLVRKKIEKPAPEAPETQKRPAPEFIRLLLSRSDAEVLLRHVRDGLAPTGLDTSSLYATRSKLADLLSQT